MKIRIYIHDTEGSDSQVDVSVYETSGPRFLFLKGVEAQGTQLDTLIGFLSKGNTAVIGGTGTFVKRYTEPVAA